MCIAWNFATQGAKNSWSMVWVVLRYCMVHGCGFPVVRYKRPFSIELLQSGACSLSAVRKWEWPLVGGRLYTIAIVLSIGDMAIVHYREVIRWWEGPLWEGIQTHNRQLISVLYTRIFHKCISLATYKVLPTFTTYIPLLCCCYVKYTL